MRTREEDLPSHTPSVSSQKVSFLFLVIPEPSALVLSPLSSRKVSFPRALLGLRKLLTRDPSRSFASKAFMGAYRLLKNRLSRGSENSILMRHSRRARITTALYGASSDRANTADDSGGRRLLQAKLSVSSSCVVHWSDEGKGKVRGDPGQMGTEGAFRITVFKVQKALCAPCVLGWICPWGLAWGL